MTDPYQDLADKWMREAAVIPRDHIRGGLRKADLERVTAETLERCSEELRKVMASLAEPHIRHSADGPPDCVRCQLIRDAKSGYSDTASLEVGY